MARAGANPKHQAKAARPSRAGAAGKLPRFSRKVFRGKRRSPQRAARDATGAAATSITDESAPPRAAAIRPLRKRRAA